jgi:uncharacterized protein
MLPATNRTALGVEVTPDEEPVPAVDTALTGPVRRDLASRKSGDSDGMLRFVVDHERRLVPDLAGRLPGRGFWVEASAESVARAVKRRAFDRQAGGTVTVPADLPALLERLLVQRCLDAIGLARRAGELVSGFDQVAAVLASGASGVLLEASDAAIHGRQKLRAKQGDGPVVDHFTRMELGRALGRDAVVHAWIKDGRLATRLTADAAKLDGFRHRAPSAGAGGVDEQQGT